MLWGTFSREPHLIADVIFVLTRACTGGPGVIVFISPTSEIERFFLEMESSKNVLIDVATEASSGTSMDSTSIPIASALSENVPVIHSCFMRAATMSACADMSSQSKTNCFPTHSDVFAIRDVTSLDSCILSNFEIIFSGALMTLRTARRV